MQQAIAIEWPGVQRQYRLVGGKTITRQGITGIGDQFPVSYTHLDVYKRQLRLTFETTSQLAIADIKLDSLPLFLAGNSDVASRLQEMIHTQCIGMVVHAGGLPIKELIPYSSDALTLSLIHI